MKVILNSQTTGLIKFYTGRCMASTVYMPQSPPLSARQCTAVWNGCNHGRGKTEENPLFAEM